MWMEVVRNNGYDRQSTISLFLLMPGSDAIFVSYKRTLCPEIVCLSSTTSVLCSLEVCFVDVSE